jgi:hypothetical protein
VGKILLGEIGGFHKRVEFGTFEKVGSGGRIDRGVARS